MKKKTKKGITLSQRLGYKPEDFKKFNEEKAKAAENPALYPSLYWLA